MADTKITGLTQQTGTNVDPVNDLLVTVDVSDTTMAASGTDKKITVNDLTAASTGLDLLMSQNWFLP